jgi:hypothetical protein
MPNNKVRDTDRVVIDTRDRTPDPNAGHIGTNTMKPSVPRTPPSGGSGVTKDPPPPAKPEKP